MWIKFLLVVSFFSLAGCQKMTDKEQLEVNKKLIQVGVNILEKGFSEIFLQQDVLRDGLERCDIIDPLIIRAAIIEELTAGNGYFSDFISKFSPLLYNKNYPLKIRRFIYFKKSYDYKVDPAIRNKLNEYSDQVKMNINVAKTDKERTVALIEFSNVGVCLSSKITMGLAGLDDEVSSIAQDLMIEYLEDMGNNAKVELEKLNNL